jgi:hypothetical protein
MPVILATGGLLGGGGSEEGSTDRKDSGSKPTSAKSWEDLHLNWT